MKSVILFLISPLLGISSGLLEAWKAKPPEYGGPIKSAS